jgi:hypothetical protein
MKFRARIFQNEPMTIALLTDLGDKNPGLSITNGIEYAVRAVLKRWPDIPAARLVVMEHYEDRPARAQAPERLRRVLERGRENGQSFDLVTFGIGFEALRSQAQVGIAQPSQPFLKRASKADFERLIGGPLP